MKATYLCMAALGLLCSCGTDDVTYDASGVFETTEVIVSARSTGEILTFAVEEGQEVQPGTPLGLIDTLSLSLKKQQLLASMDATDSKRLDQGRQVASLRQQISNLQRERNRFGELLQADAATQKQVDDIDYQIGVLQRQLAATEEQIASTNSSLTAQSKALVAQVAQLEEQMQNAVIESPIHGTVLCKYAEPGEFAAPGRALCRVGNVADMKLRAYVTASLITTLKLGQRVKVYADLGESGRKEFEGTVAWISSEAEFTPKTIQTRDERSNLVYAVKIAVKNDGSIKRGMYGDVKF